MITVRAARAGDAPALAALSTELGYPVDTARMESRLAVVLASADDAVFVAVTEEDDPIGFVHAMERRLLVSEPFVELGGLVVAEAARLQGAGRHLAEAAARWAMGRGVGQFRVRSRQDRVAAHAFYTRCGFQIEKAQTVFRRELEP